MKRLGILFLALTGCMQAPTPWLKQLFMGANGTAYSINKPTTGSVPTASPYSTDAGILLRMTNQTGYRVTVCAPSGQTLSDGGTLQAYYWSPSAPSAFQAWSRNFDLDENVIVGASSCLGAACQCETFKDRSTVGMSEGYLDLEPNNVFITTDAGVQITIDQAVQNRL